MSREQWRTHILNIETYWNKFAFDQHFNGAMTVLTQHRTIPIGRASIWATEP